MRNLAFVCKRAFSHTIEHIIEANQYKRKTQFEQLNSSLSKTYEGFYNQNGYQTYKIKNHSNNYKKCLHNQKLQISSIGIGTYKGSLDASDDLCMFNGLVDSLHNGINVADTCRNFRGGRSQKILGLSLRYMIQNLKYSRDNFFISSKAGYVRQNLPSGVNPQEVINDHCVNPLFLEAELDLSLKAIGISTLDVYYLNNFAETQLKQLKTSKFEEKLMKAFEFFQKARTQNKIKYYGLASWQSFRVDSSHQNYLNLGRICQLAEKVGGKTNGFKFVQTPINILMPETFAEKYADNNSFLDVAQGLKINVISCSPLLSGSLINVPLPANYIHCTNNGAKHLQLIRSIPSASLISTLIGQKRNRHVIKNLQVLNVPPLTEQEWLKVFVPTVQQKQTFQSLQV